MSKGPKPIDPDIRFWKKVDKSGECWQWLGHFDKSTGYARFWVVGQPRDEDVVYTLVHRYAYEYYNGPINPGMQIDHICFNRLCVNPDHLEEVTSQENNRRRRGR